MPIAKKLIISEVKKILTEMGFNGLEPIVEIPQDLSHGDYTSNIAMTIFSKSTLRLRSGQDFKSPMELAEKIVQKLLASQGDALRGKIFKIEAGKPGFINFWLSNEYLFNSLIQSDRQREKGDKSLDGKKILVEYAHPNTHKEFHIGHLRTAVIGESISRLIEYEAGKVLRTNYQGDIGPHVAKAIFGLIHNSEFIIQNAEQRPLGERIKFLAQGYAKGNKAYEENDEARKEIQEINVSLYKGEEKYKEIWETTRQWSLEYFETIYKKLGIKFDRLFFESETFQRGKEIVLKYLDGIFKKDQGAIIFKGEDYGLHNRVFVTSEGYATYEGKEMALAFLEYEAFPFDLALHVVAQEQEGYFKVVFKALELIDPKFKNSEKHLSYGMVELKTGKMSSRSGNIISAFWLINEAKKKIKKEFTEIGEEVAEKVAVGAVKYSMLRFAKNSNISFSFDESITLQGNSGPYLQYTYARTQSVLAKTQNSKLKDQTQNLKIKTKDLNLEAEEAAVLRQLIQFEEVVNSAAENFAPNLICNYIFDLAQKFNLFYQKYPILKSEKEEFRLMLNEAVGDRLKEGLNLLGIEALERM
ncbi:MAG: arginine--tRNA ligase [Patescibacteria group bacterium]|nr:arginine--tRNA ligase [Patescibacteria group bacterium]